MRSDTLTDYYQVNNSNKPVRLSLTIGNGQNAISKLLLGNRVVYSTELDGAFLRSFEKILGSNEDLSGKILQITTMVINNGEDFDRTCLVVSLTGGISHYAQKMEQISHEIGGAVKYTIRIRFTL